MQSLMDFPKLTTKEHLFISRLLTFNETFASNTPGQPDHCIIWHKAITDRKVHDNASAFLQLIRDSNVWIWAYSCGVQNKNWYLFTRLAQCVNTGDQNQSLLNTTADGTHGNIGKLFRKRSTVASFDNFVEVCKNKNSNIKTIILDLSSVYEISENSRARS